MQDFDILQVLLDKQYAAQKSRGYIFEEMDNKQTADYIKKHVQYLTVELCEFLAEIPFFKDWKKYSEHEEVANYAALEEWADVVHFFLNICLALGLNAKDIHRIYAMKNKINADRLEDTEVYKRDTEE